MHVDPMKMTDPRVFTPEDLAKWKAYVELGSYEARKEWRIREGHREFCRLQRLAFKAGGFFIA